MKISIFRLGYVGTLSAGCLARNAHEAIGVDSHAGKLEFINQDKSPIVETDVAEIIQRAVRAETLRARTGTRTPGSNTRANLWVTDMASGISARVDGGARFSESSADCHRIMRLDQRQFIGTPL